MNEWDELVQQGILGLDRHPLSLTIPAEISALGDQLTAVEPEVRFLQLATLLAQYRAAAVRPTAPATATAIPPCPSEHATTPPTGAVNLLHQLLADDDQQLVLEWLQHAARHTMYAPHATLPQLLKVAAKQSAVAEALVPCLGERGRWLMQLNPAWRIAAAEVLAAEDWQTGSSAARLHYLQRLRQQSPVSARLLLENSWPQETAKERAAFLGALRSALSAEDEPFLEQQLGDRSATVRSEAARLLAGLQKSRLQQELLAQLTLYLTLERKWLRRALTVKLPAEYNPAWTQWGFREQSPLDARIGQKAGWLVQLVALLPPSTLVAHLGVDAVEFLTLVQASDFAEVLNIALLEGAEVHQDHPFFLAELNHLQRLVALDQAPQNEWLDRFVRCVPLLPTTLREEVLLRYLTQLRERAFADWNVLGALLRSVGPLSPALTEQLLTVQLPALLQRIPQDYSLSRVLADAAYRFAPAAYPRAVKLFVRPLKERTEPMERFLHIYQLRYQMEKEFIHE
ncbi:MAG: DUF5691 domain-containing protein [Caldilineaceae bacterium]